MSEENPVVDGNEPLVEDIGTTENEANAEETEKSEVEGEGNAEPESKDIDKAEKPSNVPVEKQGDISKGAQKRINTLTRQKHEYQANIKNLESQLEQNKKFLDAPAPENLDDLSQQEQVQHHVSMNMAQNNVTTIEAQKQQAVAQHKAQVWNEKLEEKAEVYPDFQEKIASTAKTFELSEGTTTELMNFIDESEVGVDLTYYLAEHPEIANSLEGLSPRAMDRKLMRLEDKLEAQTKQPKPITQAKAPISSSKGKSAGVSNIANQTGDNFLASFRARRAQQRK